MALNQEVYEIKITGINDREKVIQSLQKELPVDSNGNKINWAKNFAEDSFDFIHSPEYVLMEWILVKSGGNHHTNNWLRHVVQTKEWQKDKGETTSITFDDFELAQEFLRFITTSGYNFEYYSEQINLVYVGVIRHSPDDWYSEYDYSAFFLNSSDAEEWLNQDDLLNGYNDGSAYILVEVLN